MTGQTPQIDFADPSQSGVYAATHDDIGELTTAALAQAVDVHLIDLASCDGKAALLQRVAVALSFPQTFGYNWDALADCLRDLSWLSPRARLLLLTHADALRQADRGAYDSLVDILAEAADTWAKGGPGFFALLELAQEATATTTIDFPLATGHDYIALNDLLKLAGLCDSGGAGKAMVARDEVEVDGVVETRKTAKIRAGQTVRVGDTLIRVTGAAPSS